jgi:hypothetical protein
MEMNILSVHRQMQERRLWTKKDWDGPRQWRNAEGFQCGTIGERAGGNGRDLRTLFVRYTPQTGTVLKTTLRDGFNGHWKANRTEVHTASKRKFFKDSEL